MPALLQKNLVINQGATFKESWVWLTSDQAVPVDLTGCSAHMQIRPHAKSGIVLMNMTSENSSISLDGNTGRITMNISAENTDKFTGESAVYDLEVIFPDGTVTRLIEGAVTISHGVTK